MNKIYKIPRGKESTEVWITQKIGKKGKTLTEKWRDLQRRGTLKHMETSLKYFDDHRNVCEHMVPCLPCVHINLLFSDQKRHLW